jgi:signal transduction histidine kinase
VDVRALVEELRARSAGGPRMPITLSTGSFQVEGDEDRLRSALGSLLNAARETAGSGEVTLDLRRDGGFAKLTISAGAGPFIASGAEGAGVGIELARMIIEAHRGRLDHRREAVSKAVRFTVLLPLAG